MYLDMLIPTAKLSYLNIVLIHTFDHFPISLSNLSSASLILNLFQFDG